MKMKSVYVVLAILLTAGSSNAAPVISNVLVTATTATTATIQWTTASPATSQIQWGTDPSLPYATNVTQTPVTTHVIVLPLLMVGPLYYAAAVSTDSTGITQSPAITFSLCGPPITPVQGTVNNYYEYGSYTLTWVPPAGASQSPTICGQPVVTPVTGVLDGGASFSTQVADASKVVPGPGQWKIQVTDAGNLSPLTVYAYLSQQSQNVSEQLQTAAQFSGLQACITNTNTSQTYPSTCGSGTGGGINALTGDVTASGSGSVAATVKGINGTILSGLASGLLFNSTGTGVPSIATSPQLVTALNTSPSSVLAVSLLPAATGTTLGAIRPDGTSCIVSGGVLTCAGGITSLTGDVTGSGTGSVATTVKGLNGTLLSGLASGILYNTTSTGVPSIATSPQLVAGLNTSPSTTLSNALLPLATGSAFGVIKPDGVSCTVSSGILACTGSGGGITTLTGDVTAAGSGVVTATVKGLNGVMLSGLSSGLLFSTTSTGIPSIATSPQIVSALNASPSTTFAAALLPLATSSAFGAIKPDGTSCIVSSGILTCAGGITGTLATGYMPVASGTSTVTNSLAQDNGTTLTYGGTGGIQVTATTPGRVVLSAGTGTATALPANAAGWHAPASGGTSYLFTPAATWTQGVLLGGTPSTGSDGTLQVAVTSFHPEATLFGAVGEFGSYAAPTFLNGTKMANAGHFTNLEATNTSTATCTTPPQINLKDTTQSTTGTAITPSNTGTAAGTTVDQAQTLSYAAGDNVQIYVSATGSGCSATYFSISAQYQEP